MSPSDFRSDAVTRPTAAMREAMAQAALGDDVFGDDPTVNQLQADAAALLGFEAALFAPSGTQSNLIALMSQCDRGDEVILGQLAHTYRWEGGGMAVLGSIQPQPIEHDEDGSLPLAKVWAAIKPDDPHFARTSLLALENTIGGKALTLQYLADAKALARQAGLGLHLDGARLFNAAVATVEQQPLEAVSRTGAAVVGESDEVSTHYRRGHRQADDTGVPPVAPDYEAVVDSARRICAGFDTVSVCLSKGLGCPIGSLLVGSSQTIGRARRIRKMLGGGMRQAGVLAAAGRHALAHHLTRLQDDHRLARQLADRLTSTVSEQPALEGKVRVMPTQTNMVFVEVADDLGPALSQHLERAGILLTGGLYGRAYRQRWVTHLDVSDADVDRAIEAWRSFCPGA